MHVENRRSIPRAVSTAVVVLVVFGVRSAETSAQYGRGGGVGAGSTVQGDILRGEGIAAMGFGQYNLATAMATSVNTDTAIRWNQYVYLSIQEDLRAKAAHREAHKQRTNANFLAILARKKATPDQSDLRSGDALNVVLMQLLDPRISPSNYRKAAVPLAGDTIRKIPFHYAQRGATFSMERMIGKREWPLRLRDKDFDSYRRDYERAIDHAIEKDIEGKLKSEDVRAVQEAVTALEIRVEQVINQSETRDFVDARNFLKRLGEYPRMLNERAIERIIAEIDTYPGTSVGDLIAFMQRHNLRFGVADSPNENVLYASLFTNLVEQREQVTLPPDAEQPNR